MTSLKQGDQALKLGFKICLYFMHFFFGIPIILFGRKSAKNVAALVRDMSC